ncbi:class I SAM-dependent methyltransferase [Maribacter sp. ACAM166]|uniref:class I SAM-dependent methyltransferase n=1 Tax=Maribacter sp. ACAM166 TaxID=2508996 RepID=UPI0010FF3A2C|nr:class I SAM-dependent methyltransferase [Maribacter sp. ACAM166]TLP80718.1 class I SAM-dependent methyltransferase [Maribacter sp. ACAM166]
MKVYLKTKDFLVSKENFTLIHDPSLDMLTTSPQPININSYYETKTYISHNDESKTIFEKIYQIVKKYTLNKKVKLINQFINESKSLLDIGSGTGEFLVQAKKKKWKTFGIEPSVEAKLKAEKKGIHIKEKITNLTDEKFNVITLWHVLEHLPNINEQIAIIEKHLEKNGTLIIAVPNFKSYDAEHYKEFWAAYDTPRHLWHFSQDSIYRLFKKHGFKVIKTLPMYFDSYYVSLLSEKYKTGKRNYLRAIYYGWLSNRKANKTGEYSSLIYVLQRG